MKLIVGVSGASGVVMSRTLLGTLNRAGCETHLVLTDAARRTWELETESPIDGLLSMADRVYGSHDMAALISSGSFVTDGMIILPCSMKTLAGIVSGYTDNLLLRAADVCLKTAAWCYARAKCRWDRSTCATFSPPQSLAAQWFRRC